ncbi:Crp/Fnr family transcriptional regulator [Amycolatopsis acidicola]|uniref:Crp/Fnr family transcriptional regulator n=1 Tax=Amycolatopsis acidicola TaxID=2596893 RepID=A0A5N0UXD5_9PSEU|nr:Crp/Fnr family transcriptional regulator [Amycolatopsis acidicola]KAA9155924.1 Crp/Fnr family transcriptional regulator [Amycolatopsis acidicola]
MVDPAVERARQRLRAAGRRTAFRRGQTLMSFGENSKDVLLIESGSLKVVLSERNGAQVVAGPYGPGELIGELGVLERRPRSATVIGHHSGAVVRVAAQVFRELTEQDRDVLVLLNATLRSRLHNADRRQLAIASQDVTTRVAAQLLAWARSFGDQDGREIVVRGIVQGDLAKAVVASNKTVDAALKTLRESGLLRTGRLRYVLPDADRLEDFLRGRK